METLARGSNLSKKSLENTSGMERNPGASSVFMSEMRKLLVIFFLFLSNLILHSVDLYGSIYENDDFGPSNLIPIFSAGKVR